MMKRKVVIGKRSWHKVPTRLLRLRALPHVRASLPSSDPSAGETSDLDCYLHIPDGADATHLTVENQASGLQLRALPVGLPSSRTRCKYDLIYKNYCSYMHYVHSKWG